MLLCHFLRHERLLFLQNRIMHPTLQYLEYVDKTDKSVCVVDRERCSVSIKGKHGTILLAYLKRFHDKEYKLVSEKLRLKKRTNGIVTVPVLSKRPKMDKYVTRTEVSYVATVTFSDKTVIDACVELVTKNGRHTLNDSGLRKIVNPITNALNMTINQQNIQNFVDTEADNWVKHIKDDIKGNSASKFANRIFFLSKSNSKIFPILSQFYMVAFIFICNRFPRSHKNA